MANSPWRPLWESPPTQVSGESAEVHSLSIRSNGSWGTGYSILLSSSTKARVVALHSTNAFAQMMNKAHVGIPFDTDDYRIPWCGVETPRLATAYAMIFLADGVRAPVAAGYAAAADQEPPAALLQALGSLNQKPGLRLTCGVVTPKATLFELAHYPFFYIPASPTFPLDGPASEPLASYLTYGGVAAMEMKADASFGPANTAFAAFVQHAVADSTPATLDTLAKATKVNGVVRADSSLAAVSLPVCTTPANSSNCLRPVQTAAVAAGILTKLIDPAVLAEDYPVNIHVESDLAAARRAALIEAVNRPKPKPVEPPPAAVATNATPEAAPVPAPPPPPVDAKPKKDELLMK